MCIYSQDFNLAFTISSLTAFWSISDRPVAHLVKNEWMMGVKHSVNLRCLVIVLARIPFTKSTATQIHLYAALAL
jgi:hypothetical protein